MKKNLTLIILAILLKASAAMAQIPNAGFEQLNYDGSLRNWGNVYLWPMYIDSSGNSYVDSLVFDGQLYFATPDAHYGLVALELRNAWDYTVNHGISGGVTADTDSVYSSWGSFETFPIQNQPFNFSFFYKYFPVNGDSGSATLHVFDSSMNQIGESVISISGTTSNYTLATAPVIYTGAGPGAFAYINFRTAAYGIEPSFGTRLLIDDVMFNYVAAIEEVDKEEMIIYPNPATEEINLRTDASYNNFSVEIINSLGQMVSVSENQKQLDISTLPPGIYLVRIRENSGIHLTKLVKE